MHLALTLLQVAAAVSDAKAAISAANTAADSSEHPASMQQSDAAATAAAAVTDAATTCDSSSAAHVQPAAVDVVAVSPWTEKWLAEQQQAGGRVSYQRGQPTFQVSIQYTATYYTLL
jgi:hypothetical protein